MRTIHRILFPALLIVLFASCGKKERYKKLDISNVAPVDVETYRYERALFSIVPQSFEQGLEAIADTFHLFLGDHYTTPQSIIQLSDFVSAPIHQMAWDVCKTRYGSIDWIVKGMETGLRRMRYFYPEVNDMVLYTYISGYNWEDPIYTINDTLILGIDNYLGTGFDVYNRLQIPQYISRRMDSAYILSDVFRELIESYVQYDKQSVLIDHIISAGKTLYFLDILLPDVPVQYKTGYTPEQLWFCENNEAYIWQFFIENNLLFSPDYKHVRTFILDSPYTSGFPMESPGRIGQWIGWQIVKAYMQHHEEVSLQQLMQNQNYTKILQDSGYKPRK